VWHRMAKIPYGKTMTYGDLAHAIGSAPRAVGGACGRNPIAIILPCHRVIGGSGALTGYSGAGGINTKQFLLELEGALTPAFRVSA
jgi:methylated-DNA-[protein]-cysteine S-methyltransferase